MSIRTWFVELTLILSLILFYLTPSPWGAAVVFSATVFASMYVFAFKKNDEALESLENKIKAQLQITEDLKSRMDSLALSQMGRR